MTTTLTKRLCGHPRCESVIRDHEIACPVHWYQLPTRLRNRIWRHHQRGNRDRYVEAVREAIAIWTPPPPPVLRCHVCRTETDFIDHAIDKPICLVCAIAGHHHRPETPPQCSRCGQPSGLLVSLIHTDPYLCCDCTINELRVEERYEAAHA